MTSTTPEAVLTEAPIEYDQVSYVLIVISTTIKLSYRRSVLLWQAS